MLTLIDFHLELVNLSIMTTYGGWPNRIQDYREITFKDLYMDANWATIYMLPDRDFIHWCQLNNLIRQNPFCTKCQATQGITVYAKSPVGLSFTCKSSDNHRESILKYYFEHSQIHPRDTLSFIRNYLDQLFLYKCKNRANIISNETSVSYGSFVRDVMSQRMAFEMETVQLKGEIEVDESQMGHIKKNGRGTRVGHPIWIFGLTERETNRLYFVPVVDRTEATLLWEKVLLCIQMAGSAMLRLTSTTEDINTFQLYTKMASKTTTRIQSLGK